MLKVAVAASVRSTSHRAESTGRWCAEMLIDFASTILLPMRAADRKRRLFAGIFCGHVHVCISHRSPGWACCLPLCQLPLRQLPLRRLPLRNTHWSFTADAEPIVALTPPSGEAATTAPPLTRAACHTAMYGCGGCGAQLEWTGLLQTDPHDAGPLHTSLNHSAVPVHCVPSTAYQNRHDESRKPALSGAVALPGYRVVSSQEGRARFNSVPRTEVVRVPFSFGAGGGKL